MANNKLDQLIEARLKQKQKESSYHKRTALLEIVPSIKKMLENNLSIKEQVEILAEIEIKISDKSYREFLFREFGEVYEEFLARNGWSRKRRIKEK